MKKLTLALIAALSINTYAQSASSTGFVAPRVEDRNSIYNPKLGEIVYDTTAGSLFVNESEGVDNWTDMLDTSNILPSKTGNANKVLAVTADETAVEWVENDTTQTITTPGAIKPVVYSATIDRLGTINNSYGTFLDTSNNNSCSISGSVYTCNFASGAFKINTTPSCTCTVVKTTLNSSNQLVDRSCSLYMTSTQLQAKIHDYQASPKEDSDFNIICHGIQD